MTELPFALTRTLTIRAPRSVVFRYFTDSRRFAAWWGEGSTIDGRVGGAVRIQYPNDIIAAGEVTAMEARISAPGGVIHFNGKGGVQPQLGGQVDVALKDTAKFLSAPRHRQ